MSTRIYVCQGKINQQHVDIVVCRRDTLRALFGHRSDGGPAKCATEDQEIREGDVTIAV